MDSPPPADITQRGAFVALSEDEGQTWIVKKLDLAPPHDGWPREIRKGKKPQHGFGTIGYSASAQSGGGVIHLLTSKGRPAMHFEMNEAWILSPQRGEVNHLPGPADASKLRQHQELHPGGAVKGSWSDRIAANGSVVLHGRETWFYKNGTITYEVNWDSGRKVGCETFWAKDGSVLWTKEHAGDGRWVWTQYWPGGGKKSRSAWCGLNADGEAVRWSLDGEVIQRVTFVDGTVQKAGEPEPAGEDIDELED